MEESFKLDASHGVVVLLLSASNRIFWTCFWVLAVIVEQTITYIESINAYKAREAFLSQECDSWEDFEDGKCTESKLAMGYGLDLKKYDYPIRNIQIVNFYS